MIQSINISSTWSIYMCVLLWQVHGVYIRGVAGASTPSARKIRNPSNRTHHRNAGHSQWQHLASRNSLFTSWISLKIYIIWNHYNSLGSMFVGNQNFTRSLGINLCVASFIHYTLKTFYICVHVTRGYNFVVKSGPWIPQILITPQTMMIPRYHKSKTYIYLLLWYYWDHLFHLSAI